MATKTPARAVQRLKDGSLPKPFPDGFEENPWINRSSTEMEELEYCTGMWKSLYWGNLDVRKNCGVSAQFFGYALNDQLSSHFDEHGVERVKKTAEFLKETVNDKEFLKNSYHGKDCPDIALQLWTYEMSKAQADGFKIQLHKTAELCIVDFCEVVRWDGNADVVGKGVGFRKYSF
jgi:hypothetical protein